MELTFDCPHNKVLKLDATVTGYTLEYMESPDFFNLEVLFKCSGAALLPAASEIATKIFVLPTAADVERDLEERWYVRVQAVRSMCMDYPGKIKLNMVVKGLYSSYKEAAAAEMQARMEGS